ncbi:MAG: carboxypeptidase-like regulatory domain-containing protein [Gemmatimonadota bacterium]|nr:carboxypeptidase-like regulatory domain-containing protein [Gemmatimonadota bacterium]
MQSRIRPALASRIAPACAVVVLCGALGSAPLAGQSVISASVSGVVTDGSGQPVPRTVVTLEAVAGGTTREAVTGNDGTYAFPLAAPGTYEIRAEAIGYAPLVARTLELAGGDVVRIPLTVQMATPPVTAIDTVAIGSTTANRTRPGGLRLAGADVDLLPYRFEDLGGIVARSSTFDDALGSQGLPSSMTVLVADGLPVYRAEHPTRRSEHLADAFFPRTLISSVTAFHNASDVEWTGAAGGYATLSTRSGVAGPGAEMEGSWSGRPLWSSDELDLDATPDLLSYQAGGRAAFDIKQDTTQLLIASEAIQHESPLAPRVGPELQDELDGLDPETLISLAAPSVERISRFSGLGRFYTQPSDESRVFFRGALTYSERTFDGAGPLPAPAAGVDETSTEFSLVSSFLSRIRPGLTLELRGGVSGSDRTFTSAVPDLPSAYLAEPGITLGAIPGVPAETSRTDAIFIPMARLDLGASGAVKGGLSARAARHDMRTTTWGAGDFLFSDAAALLDGRGFARSADAAEASFTTREFGAFAQYDVTPSPGLELSVGARGEYERIPADGPALAEAWLETSGLANDQYPSSFPRIGGRGSISWDPAADGRTRLFGVGSLHFGDIDPRNLFEAFALDGGVETARHMGSGLAWPEGTIPGTASELPTLALLGPDARPPRSLRASAGVVREIAGGLSVHVEGNFRRTDFLMRRRDLNLPTAPTARNQAAQDVYGTLAKNGALVTATGDDARRFPEFGSVWALDPDGWSEHRAVTAGLEYRSDRLDLYGAFTRSETIDNWIGAARASADAELDPLLPDHVGDWAEARSDYDVPDRVTASAVLRVPSWPGTTVAATYRYASGRPFTPRYRRGTDANGDGSFENDVPFVPQPDELGTLHADWKCLRNQSGGFAVRNSCRGPASHDLSVRIRLGLGSLGGQNAGLFVEGLNLIESEQGIIDEALLRVDPDADLTVSGGGERVTIPLELNPDFGRVVVPTSRGRMLRVGLRIGG